MRAARDSQGDWSKQSPTRNSTGISCENIGRNFYDNNGRDPLNNRGDPSMMDTTEQIQALNNQIDRLSGHGGRA